MDCETEIIRDLCAVFCGDVMQSQMTLWHFPGSGSAAAFRETIAEIMHVTRRSVRSSAFLCAELLIDALQIERSRTKAKGPLNQSQCANVRRVCVRYVYISERNMCI